MSNEITMNHLIVPIYARAQMQRDEMGSSDLSVAASQIRNNIRHGLPLDPVAGIPIEYVPDYAAWKKAEETMGTDEFAKAWAEMNDLRRKLKKPLYQLYNLKNFDGMVEIMDNPPTDAALEDWPDDWDGVRPAKSELPDEPDEGEDTGDTDTPADGGETHE